MKTCPFCGKTAEVNETLLPEQSTSTENKIPNGAVITRTIALSNSTIYKYRRKAYIIQCSDPKCIGRLHKIYIDRKEAINAWDRRAD